MDEAEFTTGLVFSLLMMGALLAFGVVAVVVFFRVWRRENKGRGRNFFD